MREREYYRKNRYRLLHGLPESNYNPYLELVETQWSNKFEKLMRNRLVMGALRYPNGITIGNYIPKSSNYDLVGSIEVRLNLYKETGNSEYLVDIANYAMLEFVNESHPDFHFKSIDDGVHTTTIK